MKSVLALLSIFEILLEKAVLSSAFYKYHRYIINFYKITNTLQCCNAISKTKAKATVVY